MNSSQSIYYNGFTRRDTISTYINICTINYHTQYTQSNMKLQITMQISCKTHKWRTQEKSRQQCALPLGTTLPTAGNFLAPRCPEPRPARTYGIQFSRWFLSESQGTLPTTRLPPRRPKRHAISQRDITRLTSTADYDGSLQNERY